MESAIFSQIPEFQPPTDVDFEPTELAIQHQVTAENLIENLFLPPPLTISTRQIEDEDDSTPGDIHRSKDGKLFKDIIEYQNITGDLVHGYDMAITKYLPNKIFSIFKDFNDGTYVTGIVSYDLPTTNEDGIRPLYPVEAHDKNKTYSADMKIILERRLWPIENIQKPSKGDDHRLPRKTDIVIDRTKNPVVIGKIPVMVGSILCHLSRQKNPSEYDKIRVGECAYQPNGSFIIEGSDQVVLLEDQSATNKFFIFPKEDQYTSTIITTTIVGSNEIRMLKDKDSIIRLSLRFLITDKASRYEKALNVISVFRLILKRIYPQMVPDQEYIWKIIEVFISPRCIAQAKTLFKNTILDSLKQKNRDDDEHLYEEMKTKRINQVKSRRNKEKEKSLRRQSFEEHEQEKLKIEQEENLQKEEWKKANFLELINDLFPQMSNDNLQGKINMLALMTARYLEFLTGNRKPDVQDDWVNKKVTNAGPAMVKIFSWWYKRGFEENIAEVPPGTQTEFNSIAKKNIYVVDLEGRANALQKMSTSNKNNITKSFITSFTYNWGDRDKKKIIKKTDILKNANIVDDAAHLLRIASQVDDRSTNMAPRMVRYDQYGFVDPADTPEGGRCGLVRNKSLTAVITVEQDDTMIINKLQNYLHPKKTNTYKTVCLVNSKFLGWCDGENTFNILKIWKRSKAINYDTSIVLDKSGVEVLFIHTDAGRLIRPFFVVNMETHRLLIDEKNMWKREINMITGKMESSSEHMDRLLREGVIEYMSPAEQSMVEVAMSVDFLNDKHTTLQNYNDLLAQHLKIKQDLKTEQFYISSGKEEKIINESTVQNEIQTERQKIEAQIANETERINYLKQLNTVELSKNFELKTVLRLQDLQDLTNKENTPKLFDIQIFSVEQLKELINSGELTDEIRKRAEILYQKQTENFKTMIRNDVKRLDELLNGQSEEEFNSQFQLQKETKIKQLEAKLKEIDEFEMKQKGMSSSEIMSKVGSNVKLRKSLQEQLQKEKEKKPIFVRKLGIDELEYKVKNENNYEAKQKLLDKLNEQKRLIAGLQRSISILYNELKTITIDNYMLKIKQEIIEFHSRELDTRSKLINVIEERILELKNKLLVLDKSISDKYTKISSENLDKQIIKIQTDINRIKRELEYRYCEIDPNAMWGVSGSIIPLTDRNQSIRNSYVCNMIRQMVGVVNTNPEYQMNTTSRATAYPSRPLIEPQLNKTLGVENMPIGTNVILAISTFEGMNQEDSLIVSKTAVENGLFSIIKHKTITIVIKSSGPITEEITDVPANPKRDPKTGAYKNLRNGIVELGSVVTYGDPLVSVTRRVFENGKSTEEDGTYYTSIGEDGVVDRITPPITVSDGKMIKIRLLQVRNVVEADKLATQSGQKGTISKIVAKEDMPFASVYNIKSGKYEIVTPDIIMNPHAVPSRMTLELLFEIILGRVAALTGERIDATSFKNLDIHNFMEILRTYGFNSHGSQQFYDGKTGQFKKCKIMVGPVYYGLLKHWVLDKIQAHGIRGKIDPQTRQPVKGRSNEGAIRMGAQERDALYAHGAGKVALERYCISSDRIEVIFCKNCGNLMDLNVSDINFSCRFCGASDPVRVRIPFGMIKFVRYMGGLGFKLSFGFRELTSKE